MTEPASAESKPLLTVHVHDTIDEQECGHGGCHYDSPLQPPEQAIALVRVVLNRPGGPIAQAGTWTCPIAFGQRSVTLAPAADLQSAAEASDV